MKTAYDYLLRMIVKDKYDGRYRAVALKDVARVMRGEPIDYVIGWKPFLGVRIDLSEKPLVPRPETEYWTEKAIKHMKGRSREPVVQPIGPFKQSRMDVLRITDVFSGSGAIGLAILKHLKNSHVDFGDIDAQCIKQIRKNLKLNKFSKKRREVYRSDVMAGLKGPYDFIFANPPYIARTKKHRVAKAVIRYEPRVALWGGEDGLRFTKKLITEAERRLAPGGELWFEFDSWQKPMITKLLRQSTFSYAKFYKDQFGKWRYCVVKK